MKSAIVVFIGAGLGGAMRHLMNIWVTTFAGSSFPYGILVINVLGSLAMGVVAGWFAFRADVLADLRLFLATGVLGGCSALYFRAYRDVPNCESSTSCSVPAFSGWYSNTARSKYWTVYVLPSSALCSVNSSEIG